MNERVAYLNGAIVPESEATVSIRDYGFAVGDGVFDSTRTVGHKPFLLEDHVERLFRSLGYMRIDPGLSRQDMLEASLNVLERNLALLAEHDDYWLTQWVTRGVRGQGRMGPSGPPTVIIECAPLPFRERTKGMRDGLDVVTPPGIRRTPPEAMSPRVKTMSYGNLAAGDAEVQDLRPGATSVLLDTRGCLAEGLGSNIFLVANGEVLTPRARFVLAGLSRRTVIEIARERGHPVREADIDLYDAYSAEEAFITSTSWCMVPVRSINGRRIGEGNLPRPVTADLIEGYKARLGGFDFVGQYLRFADGK